jgi:ZIP family zinc transporter
VLDGVPEPMVIGLAIYEGVAVGAAYLAAVFISNLPSRSPPRPDSSHHAVAGRVARLLWVHNANRWGET